MKNKKLFIGIGFVLLSSLCSSLGQLIWKLMVQNDLPLYYYIFGLCFYGIGALLLIVAFKFGEMSVLHPMLSFGFVLAMIWSVSVLGEKITLQKAIGTLLIIAGVIFLAIGNSKMHAKENENGVTA